MALGELQDKVPRMPDQATTGLIVAQPVLATTTVVVGTDPAKTVIKGTFVTPDQVVDGELVIDGGTITCVAVTCGSPAVATRITVTNSERNPCSSRGVQSCTALEAAIDHHSVHGTTCVVRSRPVGWCGDLGAARGRPTTSHSCCWYGSCRCTASCSAHARWHPAPGRGRWTRGPACESV